MMTMFNELNPNKNFFKFIYYCYFTDDTLDCNILISQFLPALY